MARVKTTKYRRAPITEAVMEVRLRSNATDKQLSKVAGRLSSLYPRKEELHEKQFQIDTTGGNVSIAERSHGFRVASDDQADIVILKPNAVTVARLAPYSDWESLSATAQDVWAIWRKANPARAVERLGIRYINRIDVPFGDKPNLRLEDYVQFYPKIPEIGESQLLNYTMQVDMPTDKPMWRVRLTSAMVNPPPLLEHLSILLDIDVYRDQDIPSKDELLWSTVEEARAVKNQIFEQCITDKSRRLFSDE